MNLIEPIHQHAKTLPNAPAIITPERNISWSELDNLIWSTALKLSEFGLEARDRVGISITHPLNHLVTALALTRMGVAHIAIPSSDSDQVRIELSKKLGLKTILSDLDKIVIKTPKAILLNKLEFNFNISALQKNRLMSIEGNITWLILQSSGTTGIPKFAELTHSSANNRFTRFLSLFKCDTNDIFFTASKPDFVVAKQRLIFSLVAGASVFVTSIRSISADLVSFLNQYKITLACGTPSHLSQLIAIGVPIPSLRAFEARSAFVNEKLRLDFKTKINSNLYIVYGTNEGEALALASPTLQQQVPNTVGLATTSIEIEIVNIRHTLQPAFETGDVRVRGPGLITEYLNNQEANARSFKDGWFYPGDLGYLTKEGALVLQGRKDDMMIFDGMNIYPAEIENVLASHPAVNEVAAFSLKHERFQDVPVAAVTLKELVPEKDLVDFCLMRLGIKHPRKIFILKEFPRNQIGKILKRELSSVAWKISN
jgi:acyl-CoA synthetase (AMP-forming)/AMP-acid ligase II